MASAWSTILDPGRRGPAKCGVYASPKRTITIWLASLWTLRSTFTLWRRNWRAHFPYFPRRRAPVNLSPSDNALPDLQERSRVRRSEYAFLQRSLPGDRSRQLGYRKIRDPRTGAL